MTKHSVQMLLVKGFSHGTLNHVLSTFTYEPVVEFLPQRTVKV